MKTMLLAAATVLSLGVGSAYAGDGSGGFATTGFTIIQAQLSHEHAPGQVAVANRASGASVQAYVTNSNRGTWLFPPNQNGNG